LSFPANRYPLLGEVAASSTWTESQLGSDAGRMRGCGKSKPPLVSLGLVIVGIWPMESGVSLHAKRLPQ
jgi:hypothetical protein